MTYLRCHYQWDFSSFNRLGLTPLVSAHYFSLGTCVHKALESWANDPTTNLPIYYANHALALRQSIIDDYVARVGTEPSFSEMRETDKYLELGLAMMGNYQVHYKTPLLEGWHPVSMEQTLTVPIPNTPHFLECTLDGIIASDSSYAIMENKTYSRHPNPDMLYRNFQFKAYTWAFQSSSLGDLLGIAYNGMWTRASAPKGSTWADLFHREIITFTPEQLSIFEQHLATIVNEMANNPPMFEHVPWDGCRCAYKEPCDARLRGVDEHLILSNRFKKRDKTPAWQGDALC